MPELCAGESCRSAGGVFAMLSMIDSPKLCAGEPSHRQGNLNVSHRLHPHRNLACILSTRGKTVEEGTNIDWSTAEALAFGSLALEKIHIRVSGQDIERGTFSQRHAVIHDQVNEQQYIPLNDLGSSQARFVICNSSLSEYGTLGFELGYSLVSPDALTCIIDQFIAAGERKWLQRTGLVMTLPHGYDGQGPEHSSGRIERFLQLCNDHRNVFPKDCNMQVVYPTTPANYFHVLHRQTHHDFRKPLIVFFSKGLLRHPKAHSDLSEMIGDTHFQRYLPEPHPENLVTPEEITRHILCTGQVYHTLLAAREEWGIKDVTISRIEQISLFPYDLIHPHLEKSPNASLLWCQRSRRTSSGRQRARLEGPPPPPPPPLPRHPTDSLAGSPCPQRTMPRCSCAAALPPPPRLSRTPPLCLHPLVVSHILRNGLCH
ncbi:2-oxoglutarate dehydrogenase complex E1 component, mitochondrial [Mycena venus]|uniref:2-oxoglutarate dehydrogenase complex E1 component, mitochondrial n=1 Tax=Mycena venus TaxID=2733690 RepID=A0A8H6X6Q1_9AGAR|nr:2-oxoglutarate dehydrogenase complex E1 component, mitochondrial [Mycena venus]